MIQRIKQFFRFSQAKAQPTTEFSAFFTNASSGEKKKFFKEIVRKANQDQRDLMKKYEEMQTKTT
jgi:hypothetical protein